MYNEAASALLRTQHGLISRTQAREASVSTSQLRTLVKSGEWVRVHYGVYRHATVKRTKKADVMLGILATGGVASHRTAAWLHGFDGVSLFPAEVTVEHGRWRQVAGVTVHQSTQIDQIDQVEIDAIPCTGVARTVLDLGASLSVRKLGSVVDALLRKKRVTQAELWDVLTRHSRFGRNGCGVLRLVLEERFGQARIALSDWSYMVSNLLEAAGLPRPVLEFRVHNDDGHFLAQVDLAYPQVYLAIELDSVEFHGDLVAFGRDRGRIRALAVVGWTVLPFTWKDYANRPDQLISQVAAVLSRASAA